MIKGEILTMTKKKSTRWVNVKRRLPARSGLYLTYSPERLVTMAVVPYFKYPIFGGWDTRGDVITHWRKLPKTPKYVLARAAETVKRKII